MGPFYVGCEQNTAWINVVLLDKRIASLTFLQQFRVIQEDHFYVSIAINGAEVVARKIPSQAIARVERQIAACKVIDPGDGVRAYAYGDDVPPAVLSNEEKIRLDWGSLS